jgi:hypothetical protein
MIAAWVWHVWIGLLLTIGAVLTVLAVGVGYVAKVQSLKYPKKPYSKRP